MARKAIQTAVNPISRSGTAHPGSMPSSQLRNGLRQRAGEISERAATAETAKSIGKTTLYWKENDALPRLSPAVSAQQGKSDAIDWLPQHTVRHTRSEERRVGKECRS